jgi:phosphonopyruvate decarboxylase
MPKILMLLAPQFIESAKRHGFFLWTGVPCSYLQPFINYVIADPCCRYVPASNEGDAVAIAAGVEIAGDRAVAMCQNSGLGNAVNPLTSLAHAHCIPLLLIVTLRGEPGGPKDEPQHQLMGSITTRMLDLMEIPWEYFPTEEEEVKPCFDRIMSHMADHGLPYGLVMRKDSVAPVSPPPPLTIRPIRADGASTNFAPSCASRAEMVAAVQKQTGHRDLVLATTGYTGRELYAVGDRENQLYLVGAMGCASSVGLGLAMRRPDLRVIVLDGDGAILMRMGALAAIGYVRPDNLVHVVLDNGMHESTGGQATVSPSLDLVAIAAACGYPETRVVYDPQELGRILSEKPDHLIFVRAMIKPGVMADLPRPAISPAEVTRRIRAHIREIGETAL